jgi:hypothetical protein
MCKILSFVVVATFLIACHSLTQDAQRVAHLPRNQALLLHQLRECHDAIPKERVAKAFVSPCVGMELSPLYGIERADVIAALGPPNYCFGSRRIDWHPGHDCAQDLNPSWEFFQYSAFFMSGSPGPNLTCDADGHVCILFHWSRPGFSPP